MIYNDRQFRVVKIDNTFGRYNRRQDYSYGCTNITSHHHHHHHVVSPARISLTLSCHPSLSSIAPGRSSRLYPVSAQSCCSSLSSCLCSSMRRGPEKYVTYEFVPTSPAVPCMSGSSNFDSFRDGLLCGVLPPGLVQYCSQHSCLIVVKLFFHTFR